MEFYKSFGMRESLFRYFLEILGIYINEAKNNKTLIMGDEYVIEPRDPTKVRFSWLEI